MLGGVDLGIGSSNLAVRADDVAHALRGLGVFAVAGAVREPDFPRRVAQKREVEAILLREGAILRLRIEARPENLRVLRRESRAVVAEPATFGRSTGRVGLGIEPEDDGFPEKVLQPNDVSPVVPDLEVRSFRAFLEHRVIR